MVKRFAKATGKAMTVLCDGLPHLLIAACTPLFQLPKPWTSEDPCFKSVQRSTEIDDLDPFLLFTGLTCL